MQGTAHVPKQNCNPCFSGDSQARVLNNVEVVSHVALVNDDLSTGFQAQIWGLRALSNKGFDFLLSFFWVQTGKPLRACAEHDKGSLLDFCPLKRRPQGVPEG